MTEHVPLEPFFEWLAYEQGWSVALRDRWRVARVLQARADWTIADLQDVVASLLAHDPDQLFALERKFQDFFAAPAEIGGRLPPLDRDALLADLRRLAARPPIIPSRKPTRLPNSGTAEDSEPPEPLPPAAPRRRALVRSPPATCPGRRAAATCGGGPGLPRGPGPRPQQAAALLPVRGSAARRGPCCPQHLLDHLADSMGYFRTERPSRRVDIEDTICETLRRGVPCLRFEPGREVCHVLLLQDSTPRPAPGTACRASWPWGWPSGACP